MNNIATLLDFFCFTGYLDSTMASVTYNLNIFKVSEYLTWNLVRWHKTSQPVNTVVINIIDILFFWFVFLLLL